MRKGILLISDGLGDRPVKELGDKTPLEYAKTPTLDKLVASGMAGLIHPYKAGTRCGTDWGHLSLAMTQWSSIPAEVLSKHIVPV